MQQLSRQFTNFYDSPMGSVIYDAERSVLKHYLSHFFGYFLIQVGGPSNLNWLATSPIRNHYRYADISPSHDDTANCYGDFLAMPFDNESVDVLFLPHTLELGLDADAMLAEVERCLISEGILISFNFVPFRLLYCQKSFRHQLPGINWQRNSQLRQLLARHNFNIETCKSFFHRPYREKLRSLHRLQVLETLGQALWPWMGNIEIIIARKKRFSVTPLLSPTKKRRSILISKEVAPTIRTNL